MIGFKARVDEKCSNTIEARRCALVSRTEVARRARTAGRRNRSAQLAQTSHWRKDQRRLRIDSRFLLGELFQVNVAAGALEPKLSGRDQELVIGIIRVGGEIFLKIENPSLSGARTRRRLRNNYVPRHQPCRRYRCPPRV